MKPTRILGALLALPPILAACGSSPRATTVVTVTVPAPATATTGTTTTPTASSTVTTTTKTVTTTAPPSSTRTETAPAFAGTGGTPAGDLGVAVAKLRSLGFSPLSTATYDPNQTLRVLIGAKAAGAQQAFFFDGAKFLGTDAAATSGAISVAGHGDTDVTLRYGIYNPTDRLCCPSGPPQTVRFVLDSGHLVAQNPIPGTVARR
jgi:hypothetical protein